MDLNEIKNRITDLLYGTTAPQGQVWKAIHEIEDQYKDEIKKLQEDLNLAVDDVIAGKVEITKLRDDLEKIQDSLDDSEAENGNLAEECGRLEADLEAAQREIDEARSALAADDTETLGEAAEHVLAAARKWAGGYPPRRLGSGELRVPLHVLRKEVRGGQTRGDLQALRGRTGGAEVSSYREPCMCGALDCVACHGESARFATWCEECQYAEEGECDPDKICPGSNACRRQADIDDQRIDEWEDRQLDREFEAWQEHLDRLRDERREG